MHQTTTSLPASITILLSTSAHKPSVNTEMDGFYIYVKTTHNIVAHNIVLTDHHLNHICLCFFFQFNCIKIII